MARRAARRWVAASVSTCVLVTSCSGSGGEEETKAWFQPLLAAGVATIAEVCDPGVCVADGVALPLRQPVVSVVDLPMPETLGPLTVERIWTGEREGLFGSGWESVWDLRLDDGQIVGPLPAEPLAEPAEELPVALSDGSTLTFGDNGRLEQVCFDGVTCVTATWSTTELVLRPVGDDGVEVRLELVDGVVHRATAGDGRTVDYDYLDGQLARATSAAGSTGYGYLGTKLASIDDGARRTYSYDDNGLLASMVDRDGGKWAFASPIPNTVDVQRPDSALRSYRFDAGVLVEVVDSEIGVMLRRTSRQGAIASEDRPADRVRSIRLADGRLEVTQQRDGQPPRRLVLRFDELGRATEVTSTDGVTSFAYSGRSERPLSVVRNGATTSYEYDERGLLVATVDPDGYQVEIERNEAGLPVKISDGLLSTSFEYDVAGRLIEETTGAAATTASYRPDGLLESVTDRSGEIVVADHDPAGRLVSFGDNASDQLGYKATGGVNTATAEALGLGAAAAELSAPTVVSTNDLSNGLVEYDYERGDTVVFDEWGRPRLLTVNGRTTTRGYDDAGQLTNLELPDGTNYQISYTAAGRIATIVSGPVTASFEWHGDLLLSATTSAGSEYRYQYDAGGQLVSSSVGELAWAYEYNPVGLVTSVQRPTGTATYDWDRDGRPIASFDGADTLEFKWSDETFDLISVSSDDEISIRLDRDSSNRVTTVATPDGEATFDYGQDGEILGYKLNDGFEARLSYSGGLVSAVSYGDRTERWEWQDGQVAQVSIEDEEPYQLSWFAPGVLSRVAQGELILLDTVADDAGRPRQITDEDGDTVGDFTWDRGGLRSAAVDDSELAINYDTEGRPTRLISDDDVLTWAYRAGALVDSAVNDASIHFTYEAGRVAATRFNRDDNWVETSWNQDGAPTSFTSSEGPGSFTYAADRVGSIAYDDRIRPVTYDDDNKPSAEATGGEFLDDLFNEVGRFAPGDALALDTPWAPWFDRLPAEIGFELPDVVTGDDVVSSALAAALPAAPFPLVPTDDRIAERAVSQLLAVAAPSQLLAGPDRLADVSLLPGQTNFDSLMASSPTYVVAESVLSRLADGPCLLCRVLDFVVGAAKGLARVGTSVYGFLTDNIIGRAVLTIGFLSAALLIGVVCQGCAPAVFLTLAFLPLGIAIGEQGVAAAFANAFLQPLEDLARGLIALDPGAVLTVAATVVAFRAGLRSGPVSAAVRNRAVAPVCRLNRVVCVSQARYGAAATHVVDAQRNGAPRLLRIDRTGASTRRASALRGLASVPGLDRDEYPFAISSQRIGLSIRYIDPTSNRSLGSYIGRQLSPLPDGARFYVLPIA